jgi:hypothetical protein
MVIVDLQNIGFVKTSGQAHRSIGAEPSPAMARIILFFGQIVDMDGLPASPIGRVGSVNPPFAGAD